MSNKRKATDDLETSSRARNPGDTLHKACKRGDIEAVLAHITTGADINEADEVKRGEEMIYRHMRINACVFDNE